MDPISLITSFAVSVAAGIVNEKLSESSSVDREIKKAFEKAKKDWSKHDLSYIKESELKIYLNQIYEKPSLFEELGNSERIDFYLKFQKRLSETENAKFFLSEIKDEARFKEIISGIGAIKQDTQSIIKSIEKLNHCCPVNRNIINYLYPRC